MKKLLIICIAIMLLSTLVGCYTEQGTNDETAQSDIVTESQKETEESLNNLESSSEREQETVKEWSSLTIDEIDAIDFVGMTYHEIVRILGSDYENVGFGAIILQWKLDDGRLLSAWLVKNGGSSLEDCIVQSFEIE